VGVRIPPSAPTTNTRPDGIWRIFRRDFARANIEARGVLFDSRSTQGPNFPSSLRFDNTYAHAVKGRGSAVDVPRHPMNRFSCTSPLTATDVADDL
jgi:hypothetical protein